MDAASTPTFKRVVFVRHGQGFHNLHRNWALQDPLLTDLGEAQASAFPKDPQLERVLALPKTDVAIAVSPLRRTIQTAFFGLTPYQFSNSQWHINPDILETGDVMCDTGDPALGRELLETLGRQDLLPQYEALPPEWVVKDKGYFKDDQQSIRSRFQNFGRWCLERQERCVIAVAHYSLLATCLNIHLENCEVAAFDLTPDGQWLYARDLSPASAQLS
ncbi:hypothetical protein PPROV_000873200 [Pycnococcus provasolii]|uniref:Phosphoglycerate mutase-like protein n=1 Tax=Pycnococcus provasolii TaxID=41880 RepID=A0A830HYT4_9CHLO|nr:hypothetical protein PPROV_000873200 [Pycnococcus provasolii]